MGKTDPRDPSCQPLDSTSLEENPIQSIISSSERFLLQKGLPKAWWRLISRHSVPLPQRPLISANWQEDRPSLAAILKDKARVEIKARPRSLYCARHIKWSSSDRTVLAVHLQKETEPFFRSIVFRVGVGGKVYERPFWKAGWKETILPGTTDDSFSCEAAWSLFISLLKHPVAPIHVLG